MSWLWEVRWVLLGLGGLQMFIATAYFALFQMDAVLKGARMAAKTDQDALTVKRLSHLIYAATIAAIVLGPAAVILSVTKLGLI